MNKSVSQHIEPNPWTEGNISFRKGNCNVLLIAPHGYPKNDEQTYDITRLSADVLDCYAIANKTFKKPPKKRDPKTKEILMGFNGKPIRHQPNKEKKWVDLNRVNQVHEFLKYEFEKPLLHTVNEIIVEFGKALVLWIHGIDDDNLTPDNTENDASGMDVLIGVGQGSPDRLTAKNITVDKLIDLLKSNEVKTINAALAKKGSDYCGWHENTMIQFFTGKKIGLGKVESIQIEIKKNDFREASNYETTSSALANAVSKMAIRPAVESEQTALDSADQKGTIQQVRVDEIDLENGQFMSRLDEIATEKAEFKRLVDSIKRHGILNPVIVRRRSDADGRPYQPISGFRRLTAFRASLTEKVSDGTTVPARVLNNSVTDDEAYQISFAENLAREDLSLWEIAQACAKIRDQKEAEGGMSKGQIEEHLAELIQKDARTVRRYLKLSSTENKDIIEAVHTGDITPTTALDIGKKDLDEDDIAALLLHIKRFPKTTRSFLQFYSNLEICSKLSKLSVSEVLNCRNADKFLSLDQKELIARIQHSEKSSGRSIAEVLQGKSGSLIKNTTGMKNEIKKKLFQDSFAKASKQLSEKVALTFKKSNIDAQFKIVPSSIYNKNEVKITISGAIDQIHKALALVSQQPEKEFESIKKPFRDKATLKKNSKGWGTSIIRNEKGNEVEAVEPIIISASRRNDTPAHHTKWLMEGLRRGYVIVPSQKKKYISFNKARLIVFWTKNPGPLMEHLEEIDKSGIGYYFQYTLNDYESEGLEPNIPPLKDRIETFKTLSKRIGPEKVVWRFDPLIQADKISQELLIAKVDNLMQQLSGFTEKLVISFYRSGDYVHALKRMKSNQLRPIDFQPKDINFLAEKIGAFGKNSGMKVATCANKGDLSFFGIEPNKCIDDNLIKRVFKDDEVLMTFLNSRKNLKDEGQRPECKCIVSEDVGSNNSCANRCLYCYANKSDKALEKNLKLISDTGTGEFLIPKKSAKTQ